ncbi:hypothetical protein CRV08_05955 [Halarcobacter ebronensis]|uniref:Cytochrome c domain-containing protein n=1 Tax=Halarcobacter ebronensis TaxID=1462615 RepID=A0A4Q0YFI0_9BACT|nr:hypothetical protein [Halarcobacter ebronensis]RXJ68973.1 hypothetical protein CRV08_05955 [Halarcobacter ebronensis]
MIRFLLLFNLLFYAHFANAFDLKNRVLYNPTAYITSQCYTKTVDETNKNILHNPCFSCHTKNKEPNYTLGDEELQESYDFPESALKNPWINLFKDRTKEVAKISDEEILNYIREDNYKDKNGNIILKSKLENLDKSWDSNNNGKWDGYIPDINFSFDKEGFDRTNSKEYTGWRAFAYRPFLGTFWPTNGSTDDVLIRLPKLFQTNEKKAFDLEVYKLNLSIIESLIKQKDISIDEVDEKVYEVDLNQNGKLDLASKIVFKWLKPKYDFKTKKIKDFSMSYVGEARQKLLNSETLIAPGLYPVGTEFAHTVRYIDIEADEKIKMADRIKELRYAKKTSWFTYGELKNLGMEEIKEAHDFPDRIETFIGDIERGLNNKKGWYYQGFIEDAKGELRPQSYEETLFCMGCHSNLGVIADSTFVFQRKLETDSFSNGWYHWNQKGLEKIVDKRLDNGQTEYVRYLKENNSGDEFRANSEVKNRFFTKENRVKKDEIEKIKNDISYLILPSKSRALELNKAYKIIVDEQSFIYGRDAHVKPLINVYKKLKERQSTGLKKQ